MHKGQILLDLQDNPLAARDRRRSATAVAAPPPPLTKGEFPQCSTQADSLHP